MVDRRSVLTAAAMDDSLKMRLAEVLAWPPGVTSSGRAYLAPRAWEAFRDGVPHLLGMGQRVLDAQAQLLEVVQQSELIEAGKREIEQSAAVVRQVVLTAAITAPPDLWLLRHVLGFLSGLGLLQRMLDGEAIYPDFCEVYQTGRAQRLDPDELDKDLHFLLSRGLVEPYDDGFRMAGHPRVRSLFAHLGPLSPDLPASSTSAWRRLFAGEVLPPRELETLLDLARGAQPRLQVKQNHWIADQEELELGFRLLPIVLGLRATERTKSLTEGSLVRAQHLSEAHPFAAGGALEVLTAAGWMRREGETYRVTTVGARSFARGPGPFGIIETYHPYMQRGQEILLHGKSSVWVSRGENVGASQDANRATFEQANDALDRFCKDTGFAYSVFIEHAIGRGEATRQRFARSGPSLSYVGADLEDAAIDAALSEQQRGALPSDMLFVRNADIGKPEILVRALADQGLTSHGAVMLVGNGFHEVRKQTDETMVDVFRGYHEAGLILLFTEENALSIDDLRATAWNTYHAGFKYVHDKSGQGLRPAEPSPRPARLGRPMLAAWSECAERAGYLRAGTYSTRTRKIYPTTPKSGFNPSISVNHFFVPADIARKLGLSATPTLSAAPGR